MRTLGFLVGCFLLIPALVGAEQNPSPVPGKNQKEDSPKHLRDAVAFVEYLNLADTDYVHGAPTVEWKGTDGATKYSLHADCSGFIDVLLMHTYGYTKDDLRKWLGKSRPTAEVYHDTIMAQKGFTRVEKVNLVEPGDFLAVKYLTRKDNTGHIMLVAELPKKIAPKKPIEPDTEQWAVKIIDCSQSGHGTTDTRHKKGANGKDHSGLGEGILRLYSNKDGTIAGWTWSTLDASTFQKPKDEHLVIGKLVDGYKP